MRFSVRVNNDRRLSDYIRLARATEAAGFDQLWVSDDLFLRSAPVLVSAMAQVTTRLEIGIGILNPYTIHPSEIAMLAATLDELTGCRFNLGLAAGAARFLRWVGIEPARPLAATRGTIDAVRGLLAGERVGGDGVFLPWTENAYLRFRAPRVTPIYLGAMSPGMLRLTGERADGALPLLLPPDHYFAVRPLVEEGRRRRSPALGELDFAACVWVSLAEDREAARRALAEKIAYYGRAFGPLIHARLGLAEADFAPVEHALLTAGDATKAVGLVDDRMLRVGIVGDPGDVIAQLEPLVAAGARHLSFGPPLGPDPIAAVALLGREVLPYFRRLSG